METLLQDLKFGAKLLWKEKVLSLTVLLTLAVCIGANTAIFSVIHAVLLEPLPFSEPDRLVTVFNSYPNAGAERGSNSAPDFFYRRERVEAFEEVAAFQYWGHTVGEPGSTERARTMRVTPSFFPLLGVRPVIGRNFSEEEMDIGNEQRVILSYGFWQERYGGDRSILGQDLRVDGRPYTIVGVLPDDFDFLGVRESRFYVPIPFTPEQRTPEQLHNNNYEMIARLRPGATISQATQQIAALDAGLIDALLIPNARQILEDAGYHAQVHNLKDDLLRDVRPTFIMLWFGVAFVLLIGCLNIANLMLARSNVRMGELATRIALGADQARLSRQLLTEAVLIATLGGLLGLAVGTAGLRLIETMGVEDLPRGAQVAIDGTVVLFTFLLAAAAGIFFGAIPLLHIFRTDLNAVFRAESRTGTASRRAVLLRSALVTAQVAIAFVLLIGAGLMFASLRAALNVDPGFDPNSVLTGYISLPESRYPDDPEQLQFTDELLREVRALPSVTAASVTSMIPFGGGGSSTVILPEGYVPRAGESMLAPWRTTAGPGYFEAMQIPLLAGRYFDETDTEDGTQVIIIDRWLANRYFPDENPVGRRMLYGTVPGMEENEEDYLYTIIGVVGDIKQNDLTQSEHVGAYYFTYRQMPIGFLTLVARTEMQPMSLAPSVRHVVSGIDPDLPFHYPETMEQRIADSLVRRRTPMLLLAGFAAVALFLAAVGIYGVLAYSVTQRTREISIRMAIGSSPQRVFNMVVTQGLLVVGLGLVVGLAGSLFLVRLVRALLYGVQPTDPLVLAAVIVTLAACGFVACLLPARRATRIDPVIVLNAE
ncbi:MAG: FtsX-like permease family protein [Gemmatimonadetes bacterium]|nr:FtsX-like permease family protein [Gemmatimonadota bacterium]NIO31955.1 FtsX-like permease family protein [Gemmatimonadota bacterium]